MSKDYGPSYRQNKYVCFCVNVVVGVGAKNKLYIKVESPPTESLSSLLGIPTSVVIGQG